MGILLKCGKKNKIMMAEEWDGHDGYTTIEKIKIEDPDTDSAN